MNENGREGARLEKLAADANDHHDQVMGSLRTALEHAKRAGDALRAAKECVAHGKWTPWLLQNFKASPATARGYMRISKNWDSHLRAVIEDNPQLTIDDALRILRPEKEKSGVIATPRLDDVDREQLLRSFRQYIDSLDDDVVSALRNQWDEIWADISARLCGEMGVNPDDVDDKLEAAVLRMRRRRATERTDGKDADQPKRR
jgi:hypothetical protein